MKIIKYPDGSSYAKGKGTAGLKHAFMHRINSYEDLWHLHQKVDAFNHQGIKPVVTIPNLIDAQADRRFNDDESFGLKLVCNFLNQMDAYFKIFHPHNQEVVEALIDDVEILDNSPFIHKVLCDLANAKYRIQKEEFFNNLVIMSSDAGGYKPLMKTVNILDWKGSTYSASKARVPVGDEMQILQFVERNDFKGKDILIVDDICVYGGTFKGLSKILRESNCGKLYLAVSHMTVQNLGEDPVTNYFDKVFTTNSKYDWYSTSDKKGNNWSRDFKNLEIIKLF